MAELPLDQGIPRFKQNEDRFDRFTNGTDEQTITHSDGQTSPTIRKFLKDKGAAVDNFLNTSTETLDTAIAEFENALSQFDPELYLHADREGVANGIATLNEDGLITPEQLPERLTNTALDLRYAQITNALKTFWQHDGANIWRNGGRAFFGGAINYDGNEPTGTGHWANVKRSASLAASQVGVESEIGHTAIFAGSRASKNGLAFSAGTIALFPMVWNDKPGPDAANRIAVYSIYGEAWRDAGTGAAFGMELDIINNGETAFLRPNQMLDAGGQLTVAAWLASGGELGTTPASLALGIVRNGQPFNRGILFGKNSLVETPLAGDPIQFPLAIGMQENYAVSWFLKDGLGQNPIRVDFGDQVSFNDKTTFAFVGGIKNNSGKFTLQLKTNTPLYINGIQSTPTAGAAAGYIFVNLDGTNFKVPIFN